MKPILPFILLLTLCITGCKKDDAPASIINAGKIDIVKGNNQSGVFGELLGDSVLLKVSSSNPADHFMITAVMEQGNGQVQLWNSSYTVLPIMLNAAGTVGLSWRMGCDNTLQKVKFYVYTNSIGYGIPTTPPSDSIIVTASAVKPTGWCKACGYGNLSSYSAKIVSPGNNILYLVNGGLFSSADGGYNWYKVPGIPYAEELVDLQFNSQKWAYLLTKNHGIYYSKDMQQWTAINYGILDMRDPTTFYVEDTAMFVSFYFDGPYKTVNNGTFWKKMVTGGFSDRYTIFLRHPDGRIMLFDKWDDLKVSSNNGDTWSLVNLSYTYRSSGVTDFKVDALGQLYIASGDATISVIDANTYQGTAHRYYQWNGSSQYVNNITLAGNDVFYLVNHTPTPGIYSKNNNWGLLNIGFTGIIGYYFRKTDGNFLLSSGGWLHYKN
jgi:hypothetical protein